MASERALVTDSEAREVYRDGHAPDAVLRPLLTIDQVASVLGVSPKTVRRLLGRGFPCVRVGRSVRFEPQAVGRWLSARREGAQGA